MNAMTMTRRSVLLSGAAFVASSANKALPITNIPLTANEIIARIKGNVGIPWRTDTVDKIVAGDPNRPVKGIAVTMMATLDVLQRASAAGHSMIITHEPTFYSHFDDIPEALKRDATYRLKAEYIREHQLAIFRFHDHWHGMTPDGISHGMERELGWTNNVNPKYPWQFTFQETKLHVFAESMAKKLNSHSMRIVGDPNLPIRNVAALWGYGSLMPDLIEGAGDPNIQLMILGETREWELVEYIQDQITSGMKRSLILLNHVISEQSGMKYCAEWIKPIVPELSVGFIPSLEPFWTLPHNK
jgi:putative NIF3 family GTP cyclohydrolase 1 type 2